MNRMLTDGLSEKIKEASLAQNSNERFGNTEVARMLPYSWVRNISLVRSSRLMADNAVIAAFSLTVYQLS